MTIDNYSVFLDSWFSEIEKVGIGVSGLNLDHLGYRVGIFELYKPLKYEGRLTRAIELIEPKEGEATRTGFEHAEFTIDFPFEDIIKKYPDQNWDKTNINRADFPRLKLVLESGLELKFNHSPILRV